MWKQRGDLPHQIKDLKLPDETRRFLVEIGCDSLDEVNRSDGLPPRDVVIHVLAQGGNYNKALQILRELNTAYQYLQMDEGIESMRKAGETQLADFCAEKRERVLRGELTLAQAGWHSRFIGWPEAVIEEVREFRGDPPGD